MKKFVVSLFLIINIFALEPRKPSVYENVRTNDIPVNSINLPVITSDGDTLTEAFVNNPSNRDFQECTPTALRLWAVKEINGVYANMMYQYADGRRQSTRFFDWTTQTWIGDASGYDTTGLRRGGYGNMVVNYSSTTGYQYHFFVTFHSDGYDYQPDVQWPDDPFNPTDPSPSYALLEGEYPNGIDPQIGFTSGGYLHQISTEYDANYEIMYNRSPPPYISWDGEVIIGPTPDACWYVLYADLFSNRLVVTYCRVSSDNHIIMLVDTMEGDMFYTGSPLQVDISQEIHSQTGTPYYIGFVGDGHPFVDRDGNIHLITFGYDGGFYNVVPVEIYHFFWNLSVDTMHVSLIQTLTEYYYPVGINTLTAGRSQIGQVRETGTLYAVWEEFIQDSGRFVVCSTYDTLAPTRIMLAWSFDNGLTWNLDTLLESDMIRDSNDWLNFPMISPVIPRTGNIDAVWWGVYDDDDPGYAWQGQGDVSRVSMLVGKKEFLNIGEVLVPVNYGLKYKLYADNLEIVFNIPYRTCVFINMYDISGKKVKTLFRGVKEKSRYKFRFNIYDVPSGTYFININTGKTKKVLKLIRVR